MQAILNVVLPVFGLILAGVLAGRFQLLGQDSSEALNRFVYFFALPAVLFVGMARVPVEKSANLPFLGAYFGALAIVVLVVVPSPASPSPAASRNTRSAPCRGCSRTPATWASRCS